MKTSFLFQRRRFAPWIVLVLGIAMFYLLSAPSLYMLRPTWMLTYQGGNIAVSGIATPTSLKHLAPKPLTMVGWKWNPQFVLRALYETRGDMRVYNVPLAMMVSLPFVIRSISMYRARARRNRCGNDGTVCPCGYPIPQGTERCSECGVAVRAE